MILLYPHQGLQTRFLEETGFVTALGLIKIKEILHEIQIRRLG